MDDILKDNRTLKEMPYGTPDGYFDDLRCRLKNIRKRSLWSRTAPYLALAAMFALLLAAGAFFIEPASEYDFTQEDFIVFSEDMTSAILYESSEQYADAVTDDDIIEYLIYADVNIDELY